MPPRTRAHAHRDDPLGVGHLVVDLAHDGAIFWLTRPATIIRSAWRGVAREPLHAEPGDVVVGVPTAIISMAQQARPKVAGQIEALRM
jgi:hypothetical protein